MKLVFRVWDPLNENEEHCRLIEAVSFEEAAESFAEQDVDGAELYTKPEGHRLRVKLREGLECNVMVTCEYEPQFHSRRV